ncbi:uncharacterized protein [Atheta coriaria]|uniref:uncharacterized protein n=1 Tax=Dalotia coriaria TaxID=877792 RepID=UPI0031F40526
MIIKVLLFAVVCCGVESAISCENFRNVFTCDSAPSNALTIAGEKYLCPENQICNSNYQAEQNVCSPCITMKQFCGATFTCLNETSFKMGLNQFDCLGEKVCNSDLKNSCDPCVEKGCKVFWTCDKADPTHFIVSGAKYECASGKVCNNEEPPTKCETCIDKKSGSSIILGLH